MTSSEQKLWRHTARVQCPLNATPEHGGVDDVGPASADVAQSAANRSDAELGIGQFLADDILEQNDSQQLAGHLI